MNIYEVPVFLITSFITRSEDIFIFQSLVVVTSKGYYQRSTIKSVSVPRGHGYIPYDSSYGNFS